MNNKNKLTLAGVLLVGLLYGVQTASALPVELVENGGFDDMLTGWNASENVVALGTHWGVSTIDGTGYMAVLSQGAVASSWLNQELDQYTGEATISFDWNMQWFQAPPPGDDQRPLNTSPDDRFTVYLGTYELLSVALGDITSAGLSSLHPFSSSAAYGWQHEERTVDASLLGSGPLTIDFNVENLNEEQFVSAYVDNVSIRADAQVRVPDTSSTLIILGCALIAIEAFRRQFVKT